MLTHVWGLMAHPNREWKQIKEERETLTHLYEHHVLLLAAVPVVCSYIGTTQVGWSLGGGTTIQLGYLDALGAGVVFYLVILAAVYAVGKVIRYMAKRYAHNPPKQSQCIVFAGYVATPMFLSGVVAIYPLIWLCLLAGTIGLCYTAYLLYLGIPAFLNISREEAFVVSSTTLAFGVLILEVLLGMTVLLWGYGERIILALLG